MMVMKTMTDDHDDTLNFGTFHINFISNTSKDDRFLNRGSDYFFKEADKFVKGAEKKRNPSDFIL